jgi:hypothetical protein
MQQYVIAKEKGYADEFYVFVFSMFAEPIKNIILEKAHYLQEEDFEEVYFGTNEALEFTKEEFPTMVRDAEPISNEESSTLKKYIPGMATLDTVDQFFDTIMERADEAGDEETVQALEEAYELSRAVV